MWKPKNKFFIKLKRKAAPSAIKKVVKKIRFQYIFIKHGFNETHKKTTKGTARLTDRQYKKKKKI